MAAEPRRFGRRSVLRAGAVAVGGAGAGWSAAAVALPAAHGAVATSPAPSASPASSPTAGNLTVAFHGPHQAGISTPPQAHLALIGLDLLDGVDAAGLSRLLRLLTDDAARLAEGRPALADTEPELAATPARLTVTFGLGPRVVTDLAVGATTDTGLTLSPLPAFETDRLEERWGQTDLALQICADDPVTVSHARRMLIKDARAYARVRWVQDGCRRARGSEAEGTTMRNVMGQVDGTVNPAEADPEFAGLVWTTGATAPGSTFMVVRRIRARMDAWDRVDRTGREAAVGRRLEDGAPLTGSKEHDEPDFTTTDAFGFPVIDPASHVARARSTDPGETFLRRSYNYTVTDPERPDGEDSGLVFVGYAADLQRQFVPVQQRLSDLDRLNEWVTTIGSAVYLLPPGVQEGGVVGADLLSPIPTTTQEG